MILTRPERQLLCNCARSEIPAELVAQTKALLPREDIRWPQIIAAAALHGVTPLVYKNLERLGWEDVVPDNQRRPLFQSYQRAAHQTFHLLKALVDILERFASAGLPVIVMKGPDLVYRVYGDPTLRGFRDLDFLVRACDVDQAKALLARAGYRLAPSLHSERLARRYHFNLPFEREGKPPVLVDLHWDLTDRFAGYTWDIQGIWDRAIPATFSGQPALVLSLEDLVTYLAVHTDVHGYLNRALATRRGIDQILLHPYSENRLIWFVDLYELLRASGARIDWSAMAVRARCAGVGSAVSSTFHLLNDVFEPRVNEAVLDELGYSRPSLGKRLLLSRLINDMDETKGASRHAFRWEALVKLRHGVQFRLVRLLDLWGYIFPSVEQIARRHRLPNSRWVALYYPAHVGQALMSCVVWAAQLGFYRLRRGARQPMADFERQR